MLKETNTGLSGMNWESSGLMWADDYDDEVSYLGASSRIVDVISYSTFA